MKQLKLTEYYQGNDIHAYEIFGAHLCVERNKKGVRFTTYAPHAQSVQVIGSFNDWSCEGHEMKRKDERGVWSIFIAGVCEGDMYKYRVTQATGCLLFGASSQYRKYCCRFRCDEMERSKMA